MKQKLFKVYYFKKLDVDITKCDTLRSKIVQPNYGGLSYDLFRFLMNVRAKKNMFGHSQAQFPYTMFRFSTSDILEETAISKAIYRRALNERRRYYF